MATNDGYSPYPLGLTALDAKNAIIRASNLSTELLNYVGTSGSNTVPTLASGIKANDVWENTADGVVYRAYIDTVGTPVLVWFEV